MVSVWRTPPPIREPGGQGRGKDASTNQRAWLPGGRTAPCAGSGTRCTKYFDFNKAAA